MKKTIFVFLIVAISAVASYMVYQNAGSAPAVDTNMENGAMERAVDSEVEMALLVASFRCDNDSSFVATFSTSMDEVTISSEGEENVFPVIASTSGKVYANDVWSFTFRGEAAVVTDKATEQSTTCTPTVNAGDAPVNFGE